MRRVLAAEGTELLEFDPLGRLLLVLGRAVVAARTFATRPLVHVPHKTFTGSGRSSDRPARVVRLTSAAGLKTGRYRGGYSIISVTVPAPTVRPPSRIAKRAFTSSATGAISSALMSVLSPGMIISTPSPSLSEPVTSVVRI